MWRFINTAARLDLELTMLRNELALLVNLCGAGGNGCPIIESLEEKGFE